MKDELLQFYTHAAEESEGESLTSTPWVSSWQRSSYPLHFQVNVRLNRKSPCLCPCMLRSVSFLIQACLLCVCRVRPADNNVSTPTFFPLDSLQKKLKDLEEENKSLRSEVAKTSLNGTYAEKEWGFFFSGFEVNLKLYPTKETTSLSLYWIKICAKDQFCYEDISQHMLQSANLVSSQESKV